MLLYEHIYYSIVAQRKELCHDPSLASIVASFFTAKHKEHFGTSYESFAFKQLICTSSSQVLIGPSA